MKVHDLLSVYALHWLCLYVRHSFQFSYFPLSHEIFIAALFLQSKSKNVKFMKLGHKLITQIIEYRVDGSFKQITGSRYLLCSLSLKLIYNYLYSRDLSRGKSQITLTSDAILCSKIIVPPFVYNTPVTPKIPTPDR